VTDSTLAWLFLASLLLLGSDLALLRHHTRAARSRRSPAVLYGTERSDGHG
jgi:hypothetical protein